MTKAELIRALQDIEDDAEIVVVDSEQNYAWDIVDIITTDGNKCYADIVIR